MTEIPNDLVPEIYQISKQVSERDISRKDGLNLIVRNGINSNSAADYFEIFKSLRNRKRFTRTLNFFTMDFFLEQIWKDFGIPGLTNALIALKLYIIYHENITKGNDRGMRRLLDKYSLKLPNEYINELTDEIEQEEIIKYLKTISRDEIINDLKNLSEKVLEIIVVNTTAYKRDNKTVAQIKLLREFKCQMCQTRIKKMDGSFYIEAAHIKPKSQKGKETPDNIILLCPNHHKEFDLGDLKILNQSPDYISFTLNDKSFSISLIVE